MVRESASLLREDVEVKMRQAGYILTILSVLIQEIEFVCRDWRFDLLSWIRTTIVNGHDVAYTYDVGDCSGKGVENPDQTESGGDPHKRVH